MTDTQHKTDRPGLAFDPGDPEFLRDPYSRYCELGGSRPTCTAAATASGC